MILAAVVQMVLHSASINYFVSYKCFLSLLQALGSMCEMIFLVDLLHQWKFIAYVDNDGARK
jgi:hypothetical protein